MPARYTHADIRQAVARFAVSDAAAIQAASAVLDVIAQPTESCVAAVDVTTGLVAVCDLDRDHPWHQWHHYVVQDGTGRDIAQWSADFNRKLEVALARKKARQ